VFHGEPDEDNKSFAELRPREGMLLLAFIAPIIFTGVFPKPMLDRIEPSVKALVAHVETNTGRTLEFEKKEIAPVDHSGDHSDTEKSDSEKHDTEKSDSEGHGG
jgi:NADH-quinone oxidoreductase subunit M